MLNNRMTLLRSFALGLLLVQFNVSAQELSLGELRNRLMREDVLVGKFAQCDRQKKTAVSGSGNFHFEPGRRIKLDFSTPKTSSMELLYDNGRVVVKYDGVKQKSARAEVFGAMIFSALNLDEAVLNKKFKVDLQGSVESFTITLVPNKRLARIIKLIELTGSDGMVHMVHLTLPGERMLTLVFFLRGEKFYAVC